MLRPPHHLLLLSFSLAALATRAQEQPVDLSPATLQSRAESVASGNLDEAAKTAVKQRYESAIAQVTAAEGFAKQRADLVALVEKGPADTATIRKQLEDRQAGRIPEEPELPADADQTAIDTRLTSERTRMTEVGRQLREIETALAALDTRPAENRERIAAVTRSITESESAAKLARETAPDPVYAGSVELAEATLAANRAELALLEQEALTFDIQRNLLQAKRDLLSSDQSRIRDRIAALESRTGAIVSARIGEAEQLIAKLGPPDAGHTKELRDFVDQIRSLVKKNQTVLARIAEAEGERKAAEEELRRLRRESENLRAQIEIGGLEDSFSEIVLDLRRTLPTPQSLKQNLTTRHHLISEARLEAFRMDRETDTMASIEGQTEIIIDTLRTGGLSEDRLAELRPALRSLIGNRIQLQQSYLDANRRLATTLTETDLVMGEILSVAESFRNYLGERLVWIASSPPLRKNAFTGMRTALIALIGPDAIAEYGRALARVELVRWIVLVALAAILLLPRRRLRRRLLELSARTRRVSTDHISTTVAALFITLWLALPLPALLAFFGQLFMNDPSSGSVTFALGKGLSAPALLLLALRFTAILCWPGGVAESHFRWNRAQLDLTRRALLAIIFLYLPAHLLLTLWWHDSRNLSAFQGPGRLVFVVAMLTMALILRTFFRKSNALKLDGPAQKSRLAMLRPIWTNGLVLLPIALALLAAMGHFLTAVAIAFLTQKTALVVLAGVLVSAFLNRWAALRGRRMALAEAVAERQARRKAAQTASEKPEKSGDEVIEVPEEEPPLDLEEIGEQARHLIRAVVTVVAFFGCWLAWSEALPALNFFDTRPLFGKTTISDLVRAGFILLITGIAFQNLSGLLELGFLRALELEAGVRNAILTLCQYAVIAIGAALAFQALGLDWSQFGWIAAALGVGIGFGLQEVVANFVSGIILLFERPIRVGDIVTVGGIDGVVTKIRIRATTITDWDKKDFVVPNKEFITGTILNWTLSNPVTRIVFPVGVAYGSDVAKVRETLLEIAREQPEVLTDPKPAAVFENFGECCLNFSLRCFVGSPDQRLELTHRVNMLIHDRFAAVGIELPFPQRDLHLKSVPEGFGGMGLKEETENGGG